MPEIAAHLNAASADLSPGLAIELDQLLGPDLNPSRARLCATDAAAAAPEQSGHGLAEHGTQFAAAEGARCFPLHPVAGIEESQRLGPDADPPRARPRASGAARDARGRFAKGHSGNPRGRTPGIPNPRRRPLGLLLRQARPGQLVEVIDRKPYLRLPVLNLVMPPKARRPDPGELLGIDFSRMRSAAEMAAAMERVVGAICRGEITPGEAALLTRRARKPLRALRRLMRREIALLKGRLAPPRSAATDRPRGPAAAAPARLLRGAAGGNEGRRAAAYRPWGAVRRPNGCFAGTFPRFSAPRALTTAAEFIYLHPPGVRRLRFRDI